MSSFRESCATREKCYKVPQVAEEERALISDKESQQEKLRSRALGPPNAETSPALIAQFIIMIVGIIYAIVTIIAHFIEERVKNVTPLAHQYVHCICQFALQSISMPSMLCLISKRKFHQKNQTCALCTIEMFAIASSVIFTHCNLLTVAPQPSLA